MTLSAILLLLSSCMHRVRVIPRDKFAKIYAEMYASDQWIASNPQERDLAETTWIYGPILKKYGYTLEDYQKSVRYYLQDPERYAGILTKASKILKQHAEELRTEERKLQMMRMFPDNFHSIEPLYRINMHNNISVKGVNVVIDSTSGLRSVKPVISDTTFRGPMLMIQSKDISAMPSIKDSVGNIHNALKRSLVNNPMVVNSDDNSIGGRIK